MLVAPTRQGNVTIDIPIWNNTFKKENQHIGLKISGGADSAILAYMLAVYCRDSNRQLIVYPITCENPLRPYQIIFAKRVISKVEELTGFMFGNHYTDKLPGIGAYDEEQRILLDRLYAEKIIDCHFMGETHNPPISEMDKWAIADMPPERNELAPVADLNGKRFKPLRHSHKQSIYDLYVYFNVLDSLFPVTRSCEQSTYDFTNHCNACSFCQERAWGFERLI